MTWLPSFVKLFLIFVAGVVLSFVSAIISVEYLDSYAMRSVFGYLRLIGLAMMLISPVLIALKFFAQLDRKVK
jgi:hypothetical protein